MKKKSIFFPILGCLSGVAGVVSGFVLACGVKDTVSALTKKAAISNAGGGYDLYSYFFGGSTQTASVDDTALMTAKLVELCGKGFGLLLIFIGLFTVCYFGYRIERELRAPGFPPPFMPKGEYAPQGFDAPVQDYAAPAEDYSAPAGEYAAPAEDYTAPAEGVYPAQEYEESVNSGFSEEENIIP